MMIPNSYEFNMERRKEALATLELAKRQETDKRKKELKLKDDEKNIF